VRPPPRERKTEEIAMTIKVIATSKRTTRIDTQVGCPFVVDMPPEPRR
jgi:hypothetical protein